MRDSHKVKEQEHLILSTRQLYSVIFLSSLMLGLVFILGVYIGKQIPVGLASQDAPLIPLDVQKESIALLLARSAEEETEKIQPQPLDLRFHDILPANNDLSNLSQPIKDYSEKKTIADTSEKDKALDKVKKEDSEPKAKNDTQKDITTEIASLKNKDASKSKDEKEESKKDRLPKEDKTDSKQDNVENEKTDANKKIVAVNAEDKKNISNTNLKADKVKTKNEEIKKTETITKGYTVQVASYQEPLEADKLVRKLNAQGFSAYKVSAEVNGNTWYRVRVGVFDSKDGAEKEMQRLKAARSELSPMIAQR